MATVAALKEQIQDVQRADPKNEESQTSTSVSVPSIDNPIPEIMLDCQSSDTSLAFPGVKYRVEWRDSKTREVVHKIHTNIPYESEGNSGGKILEIVTTFTTSENASRVVRSGDGADETPIATSDKGLVSMHIYSKAIINALRSVVEYYPSQDLLAEPLIINYPYAILVHHQEELARFRTNCNPDKDPHQLCMRERDVYDHLGILDEFLEESIMPAVRAERARYARGTYTYDMYWLMVKPGNFWRTSYLGTLDIERGFVIESVSNGTFNNEGLPWQVTSWYLDYNSQYVGRARKTSNLEKFDGESKKGIKKMDISFDEASMDVPTKKLIARGEKFFELLEGKCQSYRGKTLGFPHRQVSFYCPSVPIISLSSCSKVEESCYVLANGP
jgi:hypothetical protein